MIAKQIKGSSFSQALKYVEGKKGSRQIGTNMSGRNPRELAAEFRIAQHLNYRVNKPVYHCSLSIHPEEKLSDQQWLNIAQDYLRGMKFNHNQYVVYRHQDTDHEHIHIIANRVGLDGKTVSDSWDYPRSEQVIQQLAQKYGLSQVPLSQSQMKKAPTTGEMRRSQRTGEKPIRTQLQSAIDSFTTEKITLDELVERLAEKGIEARISYSQEGEMRGISYKLDDLAFSGYQLGKAYSINGLPKYQNVVSELEPDNTERQKLGGNVEKTETPNELSYDHADTQSLPKEGKLITEKLQEGFSVRAREINFNQTSTNLLNSEIEVNNIQSKSQNQSMSKNSRTKQKEFYRRKYAEIKGKIVEKLPMLPEKLEEKQQILDQKQMDQAIALEVFQITQSRDEVMAVLSQSDVVKSMKEQLPEPEYQKVARQYLDKLAHEPEFREFAFGSYTPYGRERSSEFGVESELEI